MLKTIYMQKYEMLYVNIEYAIGICKKISINPNVLHVLS